MSGRGSWAVVKDSLTTQMRSGHEATVKDSLTVQAWFNRQATTEQSPVVQTKDKSSVSGHASADHFRDFTKMIVCGKRWGSDRFATRCVANFTVAAHEAINAYRTATGPIRDALRRELSWTHYRLLRLELQRDREEIESHKSLHGESDK